MHIPKTGGTYIRKVLEANKLGVDCGHKRLDDKYKNGKHTIFSVVRSPYTWYESLYRFWKKRLAGGNNPYNPIITIANLPWNRFLAIMTDRNKFANYLRNHKIGRPKRLSFQIQWDFSKCPLDIGFYSYFVLYQLFAKNVFKKSLKNIIENSDSLMVVKNILKQENLETDFIRLIKSKRPNANVNNMKHIHSKINVTSNRRFIDDASKNKIYQKDLVVFKVFGYAK